MSRRLQLTTGTVGGRGQEGGAAAEAVSVRCHTRGVPTLYRSWKFAVFLALLWLLMAALAVDRAVVSYRQNGEMRWSSIVVAVGASACAVLYIFRARRAARESKTSGGPRQQDGAADVKLRGVDE